MSAPRILAQIVITGLTIVGRAFSEAYRQAALNAAKNPQNARVVTGTATSIGNSADALTRQTGVPLDEAYRILGVSKDTAREEILQKYEHLFKINDPAQGGSFYIQAKVFRAKERWQLEFPAREELKADASGDRPQ